MRQVMFGGAGSLGGFSARPDHSVDWLQWNDEVAEFTATFRLRVDAVLMGRKACEAAAATGLEAGYPNVANYLFSRSLQASPSPGVQLVHEDAVAFVRQLKEQPGKDICLMGGRHFAHTLFEAGAHRRGGLQRAPGLGAGVPAFHTMTRQIAPELKQCRQFKSGCVLLTYRVRHDA